MTYLFIFWWFLQGKLYICMEYASGASCRQIRGSS